MNNLCHFVECELTLAAGVHQHPVAVFETHAEALAWIQHCLKEGRKVYEMFVTNREAFVKRALPSPDKIAEAARAARVVGKSSQEAARDIHVETAARLHPTDPELVLFLASLPPDAGGGIQVNYRARMVRFAPEFVETIQEEVPAAASEETY